MNADQIYQLHRDDAFADQFEDDHYRTFLAMPFSTRGGYPEPRIHALFRQVQEAANAKAGAMFRRQFAPLTRVDDDVPGAIVITDEIIRRILRNHFFVGDLTGGNTGVLVETGLALALKPNARVILFSQEGTDALHFDLKVTKVNRYTEADLVEILSTCLIASAKAYEDEASRYVTLVSSQLTPAAHVALNGFGRLYRDSARGLNHSLWEDRGSEIDSRFEGDMGRMRFLAAIRELTARRLMWTFYEAGIDDGGDGYGIHATKLGWRVIETIWAHDAKMKMPEHAITSPNRTRSGPRVSKPHPPSITEE